MKFIYFLESHLIYGTIRTVYCDTDSITLASTRSASPVGESLAEKYECIFGPIVKPEMRKSWDENMSKWFVLTNEISDTLFPGKLKEEFSTSTGEMISLSPKCYIASDFNTVKFGTKGVPHRIKISLEMMRKCLYEDEQDKIQVQTLGLGRKSNQMERKIITKTPMNTVFVKFFVEPDRITCLPLRENGHYL